MSTTNITYGTVSSDDELEQILKLQKENLKTNITDNEKTTEGFVSVSHSFEVLKKMNDACPHIIAKVDNKVVGYALCMLKEFKEDVPALITMFDYMDSVFETKNLSGLEYIIMGQICIDKSFRKKGIFRRLYNEMTVRLKPDFDFIVTEVNTKNRRSSNAHQSVGFEIIDVHAAHGEDWELIVLKL